MKISLTLLLWVVRQWLLRETLGAEAERPRAAPQCRAMDPDGQCVMEDDDDTSPTEDDDDWLSRYLPTCDLYMAESSIPNSGWGMYAAQEFEPGEEILPLDLVVQVLDLPMSYREGRNKWLLAEYVWNSGKPFVSW